MMFRKISLFASLLFFLVGTNVYAHSHLESSSPKNGSVQTESLHDIRLTFETNLESTSSFNLTDVHGTVIPIDKVSIEGNMLMGSLKEDLSNGDYKIHWKIIGTDGHPLEGDLSFSIYQDSTEAATTSTTVEQSPADAVNTTKVAAVTQSGKEVVNAALLNKKAEAQPSLISYVVPGAVAILLFFGFGSYWLIFRRKHV